MARQAYKLNMVGPLHIGSMGIGVESTLDYIPSDTLFGALVITWLQMGEQALVNNLGTHFVAGQPPALLLTSAFPYAGDILFLPRPQLPITLQDGGKKYKKVQWVSPTLFNELTTQPSFTHVNRLWQNTKDSGHDLEATNATYALMQGGTAWVTAEERAQLAKMLGKRDGIDVAAWARQPVPHVAVGRQDNASQLYYVGQVHFANKCGVWFMAESTNATWLTRTEDALLRLQDSGVGGRRFRGNGNFVLDAKVSAPLIHSITPSSAKPAHCYQVLLSRLAPAQSQMALLRQPFSRYSLTTVGGYSSYAGRQPLVRQRVRLLQEGSIIGLTPHAAGKLVNVNPFWDDDGDAFKDLEKLKDFVDLKEFEQNGEESVPTTFEEFAAKQEWPIVPHAVHRYGYGFGIPIVLPSDSYTQNASVEVVQ